MSDPATKQISSEEIVSRFVRSKHWIRASNNTVKPDAFMPPSDLQLSVTRQTGLSEEALWQVGQTVVAEITGKDGASLLGRADLAVGSIMAPLTIEPDPLPTNLNHAQIVGWPEDKPAKKNLAQRLAAISSYQPFSGS